MLSIKQSLYTSLNQLAECSIDELPGQLHSMAADTVHWRVSHPINEHQGTDQAVAEIYGPLKTAMPDMERRDLIFVGGEYEGRQYIAAIGHYCGTFARNWLSIPANHQAMYLRYGEVYQIEDGKIVQANMIWDVLDFIRQAGFWPLAPSLGSDEMWSGPQTGDGLVFKDTDSDVSAANLAQTLAMHKTLFDFDQQTPTRDGLLNMDQKLHWHSKMMWYGPSGLGTARGLEGFVDYHQLPFREAFQRPKGSRQEVDEMRSKFNAKHYIRIGDGDYSVTGGWPSFPAQHYGGSFAGATATNRIITMRVMDFYHHHEGLIRENWVPIDMLDTFMQMGFDILERLQPQFMRGPRD